MSDSGEREKYRCDRCGSAVSGTSRFCEACGSELRSAPPVESGKASPRPAFEASLPGRAQRVLLALGIVFATALILAAWFLSTSTPREPVLEEEAPGSETLFPVEPVGVDSINNTIDGVKVAIDGDGHIMNSPGLGVDRPVWCLVGPVESAFTVPVHEVEGRGSFSLSIRVLLPVLREEVGNPREALIELSLSDRDGEAQVSKHRLKGENRWQPLEARFAYDSRKAPYRLRFIATGFEGAIYFDHSVGPAAK